MHFCAMQGCCEVHINYFPLLRAPVSTLAGDCWFGVRGSEEEGSIDATCQPSEQLAAASGADAEKDRRALEPSLK